MKSSVNQSKLFNFFKNFFCWNGFPHGKLQQPSDLQVLTMRQINGHKYKYTLTYMRIYMYIYIFTNVHVHVVNPWQRIQWVFAINHKINRVHSSLSVCCTMVPHMPLWPVQRPTRIHATSNKLSQKLTKASAWLVGSSSRWARPRNLYKTVWQAEDATQRTAPHHTAPYLAATCGKVSSQTWAPNDAHRSTLSKLQATSGRERGKEAAKGNVVAPGKKEQPWARTSFRWLWCVGGWGSNSSRSSGAGLWRGLLALCHMLFNQIQIYYANTHTHTH